jgi:predicted RNA polymerase sigma factor
VLAEDRLAEAFARAWVSWQKVSRHPAPRAWVVHTALNAGASWWRRRVRERPLAEHDVGAPARPATGLDSAVLAAVRRLPARQREVLVLRVFLDLDIETTAAQLAIAPGTRARGRARRGHRRSGVAGLFVTGAAAGGALALVLAGGPGRAPVHATMGTSTPARSVPRRTHSSAIAAGPSS